MCRRRGVGDAAGHGGGRGRPEEGGVHHHRGPVGAARRPAADAPWNVVRTRLHARLTPGASALSLCPPSRSGFVVEVPVPPEPFSSLPQELKDGGRIRVEPVLFNIGINQQQSLAERYPHTPTLEYSLWDGLMCFTDTWLQLDVVVAGSHPRHTVLCEVTHKHLNGRFSLSTESQSVAVCRTFGPKDADGHKECR